MRQKFVTQKPRGDKVNRVDINRLLLEMRSIKAQTQAFGGVSGVEKNAPTAVNAPQFGDVFSQAVAKVNDIQKTSSNMAEAYVRGDSRVDVTDVMIASQKASVSFAAMSQVRNKLVDAYKDIMNMPV